MRDKMIGSTTVKARHGLYTCGHQGCACIDVTRPAKQKDRRRIRRAERATFRTQLAGLALVVRA